MAPCLQLQYLQAQADLLMLLCSHKVISHNGTENWSKMGREAHSRASQLERHCQDLEAQLRAEGLSVPDQVQVARHYAAMVYEQRQLQDQGLPQKGPQKATNPEQELGPLQQHVLLRQDDTNSRASPARACDSEQGSCQRQQQQQAPHDRLGHGMSSQLPYHPAQPKIRVPPVKWKGVIALGQNGTVQKSLRTGRLHAERMRSCGSSPSSITDLKNTWIPLVFPLLEAVPDLKDLIPEVGLLTFGDDNELASMADFARRQGWYADRVSSGVACGKSALIFNDGYLAHQEMSVYVLTQKSQWAQETFLDQLHDTHKQLFLADKAFLLLFRLGPPKRPNAAMPTRGDGVRGGQRAVDHAAAPGVTRAPVVNSTRPPAAAGSAAIAMGQAQAPGTVLRMPLCPDPSQCMLGTAAAGSMPLGVAATVGVPPQAEVQPVARGIATGMETVHVPVVGEAQAALQGIPGSVRQKSSSPRLLDRY
ncbi:hypothetical protein Vafri_2608 [Volvox africanus]|uniref:Uncharacterized protein n=1 Tax=Volvox africanus TaxID=51714 RepID=A0A8J4AQK2_9CHLO|nr:hypothetical protein Vafri_2608 [Volvox africanus]